MGHCDGLGLAYDILFGAHPDRAGGNIPPENSVPVSYSPLGHMSQPNPEIFLGGESNPTVVKIAPNTANSPN
jgi:hypothetical protein